MLLRDDLHQHRHDMHRLAAQHGAYNLRVFGSVARGEERPDSDVDLLVDLAEDRGFSDYLAVAEALQRQLGRKVDLVLARSLSPHFRPYIEADARPL
jgi:predicted nucleotidyltransferase